MDPFALPARSGTAEAGPDYLALPTEMHVFRAPSLPDDPAARARCRAWLQRIGAALEAAASGAAVGQIVLDEASAADCASLDEILLDGEVSALVLGAPEWQIGETAYTGLWRLRARDAATGRRLDRLEIGPIPAVVAARAAASWGLMELPAPEAIPPEMVNAPHVLAELRARSAAFRPGGAAHVINLGLLPLAEAELTWLVRTLGEGPAIILSGGYGTCRIRSTRLAGTWWVQYYNAADALILNTLEIAAVPAVACAAQDDIAESASRVRALEAAYP
ncbi:MULTISPECIES: hydrogenase expression/formation protein [unclassified Acidiphilium]|nr:MULTISPECIES: hydrogenase expression/formation protein [unclassified Acidiphilium]EGO95032.1 HupH hydrogenase expression protein [Acidiphilium sp. PM]